MWLRGCGNESDESEEDEKDGAEVEELHVGVVSIRWCLIDAARYSRGVERCWETKCWVYI